MAPRSSDSISPLLPMGTRRLFGLLLLLAAASCGGDGPAAPTDDDDPPPPPQEPVNPTVIVVDHGIENHAAGLASGRVVGYDPAQDRAITLFQFPNHPIEDAELLSPTELVVIGGPGVGSDTRERIALVSLPSGEKRFEVPFDDLAARDLTVSESGTAWVIGLNGGLGRIDLGNGRVSKVDLPRDRVARRATASGDLIFLHVLTPRGGGAADEHFLQVRDAGDGTLHLELALSPDICTFPTRFFADIGGQVHFLCSEESGVQSLWEIDADGTHRRLTELDPRWVGFSKGTYIATDPSSGELITGLAGGDIERFDPVADQSSGIIDLPDGPQLAGIAFDPAADIYYVGRASSDFTAKNGWVSVHDASGNETGEILKGIKGTGSLVLPLAIFLLDG